jgi:hypothetical protein
MNYAVDMSSDTMILVYVPVLIKIGFDIHKLVYEDTQRDK